MKTKTKAGAAAKKRQPKDASPDPVAPKVAAYWSCLPRPSG